jgi:predicted  nucleic acid-binding Zn-ribbon protein
MANRPNPFADLFETIYDWKAYAHSLENEIKELKNTIKELKGEKNNKNFNDDLRGV